MISIQWERTELIWFITSQWQMITIINIFDWSVKRFQFSKLVNSEPDLSLDLKLISFAVESKSMLVEVQGFDQ